jgi:hypothetical protein
MRRAEASLGIAAWAPLRWSQATIRSQRLGWGCPEDHTGPPVAASLGSLPPGPLLGSTDQQRPSDTVRLCLGEPPHISSIAGLHRHDHELACYCTRRDRWDSPHPPTSR